MALISLEDLDGLDDDDDITDDVAEPQPMNEEHNDRLLHHWQAVGSTHHVTVPAEMTGPIQEMTSRNQQRELIPFCPVSTHEKLGEVLYEERLYPAGHWAQLIQSEKLYEQSISLAFMKLMRFICKENSKGRYLGMTIPIVNSLQVHDGKSFSKDVMTSYFLPAEFQTAPPTPTDPDIQIVFRPPLRVVTRTFYGSTTEQTVSHQIRLLWDLLLGGSHGNHHSDDIIIGGGGAGGGEGGGDYGDLLRRDDYMVAAYENPGVSNRRNEIWFLWQHPGS